MVGSAVAVNETDLGRFSYYCVLDDALVESNRYVERTNEYEKLS